MLSFIGYSQNHAVRSLFFNIPIYESRDSIYKFCKQNDLFNEKKNTYKVTRNGKEINTYYGSVKVLDRILIGRKIDSAKVQVATGGQRKERDTTVTYILPITSYYYFTKKRSAKKFFKYVDNQLSTFTNIKTSKAKVFDDEKLIGYLKNWSTPTKQIDNLSVQFEKGEDINLFKVMIKCVLYE